MAAAAVSPVPHVNPNYRTLCEFNLEGGEGPVCGTAYVSDDRLPANPYFKYAQDHIPLAYALVRGFLTPTEVGDLDAWFTAADTPGIKRTEFNGDDLPDGLDAASVTDQPVVAQLYGNPGPFEARFPAIFQRLISLKDTFGTSLRLSPDELAEVTFAQDIRHVTYHKGDSCPWHRDDPTSHFNTIMMTSRPGQDFQGGVLQFHPHLEPTDIHLQLGDAAIYATAKVDHAVTKVTEGVRKICLVELKKPSLKNKD